MDINSQKIETAINKLIEAVGKRQSDDYTQIFGYVPRDLAQKFREICAKKRLQHSDVVEGLLRQWVEEEENNGQ